ncbi:MAG: hypothetical protein WEE89_13970 [Gemmatimonadota bacterium]
MQDEIENLFSSMRGMAISPGALERAYLQAIADIKYTAAVERIVLTADGTAWVTQRAERGAKRLVNIELSSGRTVGSIVDPAGRTVVGGSREFVWLLERDENDIEFVVKRAVVQP